MIRLARLALLALALLPAACGDFPQPMLGNPGRMGALLAHPPPQRIVVPTPHDALLGDQAAKLFATDLANALVAQTIPAFAARPQRGDWVLGVHAVLQGDSVVPSYTITDPRGHKQGNYAGPPVSSASWAAGDTAALADAANAASPGISDLLSNIDAVLKQNDPNSLYNRPPRVAFSGVTGAPGDGNQSLAKEIGRDLPGMGVVMVQNKDQADYLLSGKVKKTTVNPQTQRVELTWIVTTPDGKETGRVSQVHDIPTGSLDSYWGDVAAAAGSQAALGIKEVIDNAIGKRAPKPGSAPTSKTTTTSGKTS
jgi:hypothetical protein